LLLEAHGAAEAGHRAGIAGLRHVDAAGVHGGGGFFRMVAHFAVDLEGGLESPECLFVVSERVAHHGDLAHGVGFAAAILSLPTERQRAHEGIERLQVSLGIVDGAQVAPGRAFIGEVAQVVLDGERLFEALDSMRLVARLVVGQPEIVEHHRFFFAIAGLLCQTQKRRVRSQWRGADRPSGIAPARYCSV
jgi:hypothetical protein